MNKRGFVVEAGASKACRAEVMEPLECNPRQAVMTLVTLDEALNNNGSLQAYRVSVWWGDLYMQPTAPFFYLVSPGRRSNLITGAGTFIYSGRRGVCVYVQRCLYSYELHHLSHSSR